MSSDKHEADLMRGRKVCSSRETAEYNNDLYISLVDSKDEDDSAEIMHDVVNIEIGFGSEIGEQHNCCGQELWVGDCREAEESTRWKSSW